MLWFMAGNEVKLVSKTLYVGNLPWATTDEDLAAFFSDSTEVLASRVIIDRATGRSKGFGFVEVPDEQAEQVIAAMNGKELGGREIIVNEARPLNTTSWRGAWHPFLLKNVKSWFQPAFSRLNGREKRSFVEKD